MTTPVERVSITIQVDVDVAYLAEQFAALSDDSQAQFLCLAAAKIEAAKAGAADFQAFFIGRHLATCSCSTEGGRAFVREISRAMESQEPA